MTFHERHQKAFEEMKRRMHEDMASAPSFFRRPLTFDTDWNSITKDMSLFNLKPSGFAAPPAVERLKQDEKFGSSESLDDATVNKCLQDDVSGARKFQCGFNVRDYDPKDISVRVEGDKLLVQAKHEEVESGGHCVKEFKRTMNLPKDVDVEKLSSTLSTDGILTIEAPVPPRYQTVMHIPPRTQLPRSPTSPTAPSSVAPTYHDTPEGRRMALTLDVGDDVKPENLVVKVQGNILIVEAAQEEVRGNSAMTSSLRRQFQLQEDIEPQSVTAGLAEDGKLVINANVTQVTAL